MTLSGCTFMNHMLDDFANDAPLNHVQQTRGMEQRKAIDYYMALNDAITPGTKVCLSETVGIGVPTLIKAHLLQWKHGQMRIEIEDVSPTGITFHGIAIKAGDIVDVEPRKWFLCRP